VPLRCASRVHRTAVQTLQRGGVGEQGPEGEGGRGGRGGRVGRGGREGETRRERGKKRREGERGSDSDSASERASEREQHSSASDSDIETCTVCLTYLALLRDRKNLRDRQRHLRTPTSSRPKSLVTPQGNLGKQYSVTEWYRDTRTDLSRTNAHRDLSKISDVASANPGLKTPEPCSDPHGATAQ
jgi:hypothetical protein